MNPTGYAQVVEEIVGGQVQRAYTYGTMLISQRQLVSGSYVVSHYGYDGSENVRFQTNSAGVVTDTFDYDAFGNLIGRTGTTANNYLYRGQQFDADLGFYYQRARYYSQQRGRFLTMDRFSGLRQEPHTMHKYLYVHGDPVNSLDPSGNLEFVEYGKVLDLVTATALILIAISIIPIIRSIPIPDFRWPDPEEPKDDPVCDSVHLIHATRDIPSTRAKSDHMTIGTGSYFWYYIL